MRSAFELEQMYMEELRVIVSSWPSRFSDVEPEAASHTPQDIVDFIIGQLQFSNNYHTAITYTL